jgi:hypothetical protein
MCTVTMSAHALKLKKKLEKFRISRELFEDQKRLLDMEMVKCNLNMSIISKGMKNKVSLYIHMYIYIYIYTYTYGYIYIC